MYVCNYSIYQVFISLRTTPNPPSVDNVQSTWRNRSCQQAALAAKQLRTQWLPLAVMPRNYTAYEAFTKEKSQQNGGAHKSHVTSLCIRPRLETHLADTTRFTMTIPNHGHFTTTPVDECNRNILSSPRSVVCANEQTWRPFCTSLRRQLSSATR